MIVRPPVWVTELATRFWAEVGELLPFPRDLRAVACWLPDLHLQAVPHLTTSLAVEHFARFNIPTVRMPENRRLHGCFGSHRGTGVILFDPTDPDDEQRFTFAHELAHFLRDCQYARRTAVTLFGPGILEGLDGDRPATVSERLAGTLRGVTAGCHTHFLERDRWGRVVSETAKEAEAAADRLAFELLAPFDTVNPDAAPSRDALVSRLTSVFGLPSGSAAKYAALLLR